MKSTIFKAIIGMVYALALVSAATTFVSCDNGTDPGGWEDDPGVSGWEYEEELVRSATPTATITTVAKTSLTHAYVDFTLTNETEITGTWEVYTHVWYNTLASDVTAAITTWPTLRLTHTSDIPAGYYYVSVTEDGKYESERLALFVSVQAETVTGVTAANITEKLAALGANDAAHPHTLTLDSGTVITNSSTWGTINTAVHNAQRYVVLDLIACTAANNTISGTFAPFSPASGYAMNTIITNYVTGITLPSTLTSIGDNAFYFCDGLTSVTIGDSVTSIGKYAFSCTSLTSITIPASVTSIGGSAFYYCDGLTSVTIGGSVTSIGDYAFQYCTSLTSVTIPASVTRIGDYAFQYCTSLTSITVDTGNANYASVDGVLFNNAKTELIQYPASKTGTAYTIPSTVTSIGQSVFNGCASLTSVTIPASVTSIGYSAFQYCTSLTSVTFDAGSISSTNFANNAFGSSSGYSGNYIGDLRMKYLASGGGAGTYTRESGGTTWTKQE
ncbi:MAG: leucine-rich repeat domain-containing protein [Spirochaetaceae bacterium]|jgi:hypothetical protein|nr:leucine-rich repeat domain-containing protein [Spirochaetaceae bacterium]